MWKTYSPSAQKLNFNQYRLNISDKLFWNPWDNPQLQQYQKIIYLLEILSRNKNRKVQRKISRQCSIEGKYRRSNYSISSVIIIHNKSKGRPSINPAYLLLHIKIYFYFSETWQSVMLSRYRRYRLWKIQCYRSSSNTIDTKYSIPPPK